MVKLNKTITHKKQLGTLCNTVLRAKQFKTISIINDFKEQLC